MTLQLVNCLNSKLATFQLKRRRGLRAFYKMAEKAIDLEGGCCVDDFRGNCGMRVIYDLYDHPVGILKGYKDAGWGSAAIVAFSDNHINKTGARLARYIRKHKLGAVRSSTTVVNDNSGNKITAWYWTVDHKAFDKWVKENKK